MTSAEGASRASINRAGNSASGARLRSVLRLFPGSRPLTAFSALFALLVAVSPAAAQDPAKDAIRKRLEAEYHLTKTTDDKTDIVTAGSVLVLHKDKVLMVAATSSVNPCMNTYKDGKITPAKACGVNEKIKKWSRLPGVGGGGGVGATRNFVSGEKFWVTQIDVRNDGVVFHFFTDAIGDTRYISALTIPFGALTPSPDEALKTVSEVITVAPADNAGNSGQGNQQGAPQGGPPSPPSAPSRPASAPAAAEAPPPPLDTPPPPAADPVQVSMGQTPDQVVAILGQPLRKAKTATREIYFYKDLKITFVNGKVKDVE